VEVDCAAAVVCAAAAVVVFAEAAVVDFAEAAVVVLAAAAVVAPATTTRRRWWPKIQKNSLERGRSEEGDLLRGTQRLLAHE